MMPGACCLHLFTSSDAEESAGHWKHCAKPGVWCNHVALRPRCQFFFFGTLDLRTTKVEIRGLHVLIDDKISKYHEVARFQHRSRKFKEQHIAA